MKIYTKVVMDWDGNVLEEESHDYHGPVAECKGGGGGGDSTTKTVAEPWKGVQPFLKDLYGDVDDLYQQGMPAFYPGQTYVNRDPLEDLAQGQTLAYSQQAMPGMIGDVQRTAQFMLGAPDAANNPYVSGMADTIEQRMNQNLLENQLPAVGHGAVGAGQYGGSRHGIAEAQAIERTNQAYGDALAQLYGGAYEAGLEQQAKGMAFAPGAIQMGMAPAEAMGSVGAYNRGEQELALQEDMARYQYNTMAPYENIGWANQMYAGAPWGGSSTTQMSGRGGNAMTGALGGAMLGASAVPMLGGTFGSAATAAAPAIAASPWAWPVVAGGALLGGLFG
jgi:hypothetical protein